MPSRPRPSANVVDQDDSLVVHPATQAGGDSGDLSQASSNEDDNGDAQVDSQGFWEADAILDATATKYRISWKSTDENGEPWEPTWEPKENANAQLVQHWREVGRAQMKAAKRREKEERQEAKKAARLARAVKTQRKKPSSSSASASTSRKPVVKVDVPPARSATKRKMVVSESDTSSQPSQPHKKKAKAVVEDAVEPQPVAPKKRVVFDLNLSNDEADQVSNDGDDNDEQDSAEASLAVDTAPEPVELERADEPAASSGSTNASVVPDSQAAPPLLDHSAASLALPFTSTAQTDRPPQPSMHSPVSSQLDLEDRRSEHGDDDIAIFDPLQHNNHERTSSAEPEPLPHLRPVPIPAVSAFQLADSILVRSSQLDPIEDPDSSPRRSPFRRQQGNSSPHHASPRPRPAKTRLELVSADQDEVASPLSSFELEVLSATAASYVSLPMSAAEAPALPAQSTSASWSHSRASVTAQAVKRPLARAPDALAEVEAGLGVAARAAVRLSSPDVVVEDEPDFAPTQGGADDEGRQLEFFDEIFDYDGGAASTQQVLSTTSDNVGAGREAQDAGEGSTPHGYSGYGASGSYGGSQQGQQQQSQQQQQQSYPPQQQQQHGGASSSSYGYPGAPSIPGGYGFGSAPGFPGSGYRPILPAPYGHPHVAAPQQPQKRDLEDTSSEASKKARTESTPQPHAYPAAAHAHSPYSTLPPSITAAYNMSPSAYGYPSSYGPSPGSRPPALNVHAPPPLPPSAGPTALASPSLARVQSQDPFGQARATPPPAAAASSVGLSTGLSSPLVAPAPAHRSPSPLPPSDPAAVPAPASPSIGGAGGPSGYISRNSSPAPGPGKADEVVALVKGSPHIVEEDGTKAEIERFLRDPKTYSTSSSAPLMRSEFWAFELRHVTVDGVDKVDFIILRTHQSTFQLKRAVVGKVPVDFARSLSHTLTRPRGLTPAVEAVPTLAMSSPVRPQAPPPPPAPSTMTREQLEQEVERLRQQRSAHEVELATLRPLAAETAKLKVDCQALTKTNKSLLASRESTQSDLSYMQAQYQAASGAAVERANEARAAEAEAAKLRGLLDTGLKQKELVYAGQIKTVKTEYARLKQQMRHYQVESKRTQEQGIREKAAKWDEHVARFAQEQKDAAALSQGQPLDGVDSGDDDEAEDIKAGAVGDDSEEQEPSTINTSATFSQLPSQVPVTSLGLGAPGLVHPLPAALDAPMPPSSAPSTNESTMLPVDEFRCEWRTGNESQAQPCGAVKATKEDLQEHLVADHLAQ